MTDMHHDHLKSNLLKLLLKCQRKERYMKSRENVTCKTQCLCMVILVTMITTLCTPVR